MDQSRRIHPVRPLLLVHPDFPWSKAGRGVPEWTEQVCLPVLCRMLAAARYRRRLAVLVFILPFSSLSELGPEVGEAAGILHELEGCATQLAPEYARTDPYRARQWLNAFPMQTAVLAGGFWRHHCVAEVRRAIPSVLSYPLTVPRP